MVVLQAIDAVILHMRDMHINELITAWYCVLCAAGLLT
jgi:hypothetical protein